ncbi:AgrD family cyclic lactone autoinducer peptide [Lysinibacillus sp. NPDC097214]
MLKYFTMLSATVFIRIAESSINMMCLGAWEEIELPEEMKNTEL